VALDAVDRGIVKAAFMEGPAFVEGVSFGGIAGGVRRKKITGGKQRNCGQQDNHQMLCSSHFVTPFFLSITSLCGIPINHIKKIGILF
jgi:hypothetical protein